MGFISLMQGWGATHLFTLGVVDFTVSADLGNSVDPTNVKTDQYNTEWDFTGLPVCEGFSFSLKCFGDITDYSTKVYAGELDSRGDFNSSHGAGNDSSSTTDWNANKRSMFCWVKPTGLSGGFPTAVFGHGGGTNNQLFFLNLGGKLGFQAADAGMPFLIATSIDNVQIDRPYFMGAVWEHHTAHSGDGNRILFYLNGKLQSVFELTGTDNFASATGQPFIGNASSNYQGYGGGTIGYLRRPKDVQAIGSVNNVSLTESQWSEAFESAVLPTVIIQSDTVENQQVALDALIGNNYNGVNCAIRILQATDEVNYRLFLDTITFSTNTNILDISIQFIGDGILTLENANGSNASVFSTPSEVVTNTETLNGTGSIVLVENTFRVRTVQDLENINSYDKIVIESPGDYTFTNVVIDTIENVSGGIVNVISSLGISNVINTGLDSETNIIDSFLSFSNSWELYESLEDRNATENELEVGGSSDIFRFSFVPGTTYYLWVEGIKYQVTPISTGETSVNLSTGALLTLVNENLGFIDRVVYCDNRLSENGNGSNSSPFNNLDDAVLKFNEGSYSHISLKTAINLPASTSQSLDNVKIRGANPTAHLLLMNNSMNAGELDDLLIQGVQDVTFVPSTYINCSIVGNISGIVGKLQDIQMLSLSNTDIVVQFGGDSSLIGCNVTNVGKSTIDLTGGVSLAIRNITGNFYIDNVVDGSTVSVDSISGSLTLNETCTGGSIRVFDTIRIIDDSNGSVLDLEDLPTLKQIEESEVLKEIQTHSQQSAQNSDYNRLKLE